jgi:hypothetical protein
MDRRFFVIQTLARWSLLLYFGAALLAGIANLEAIVDAVDLLGHEIRMREQVPFLYLVASRVINEVMENSTTMYWSVALCVFASPFNAAVLVYTIWFHLKEVREGSNVS